MSGNSAERMRRLRDRRRAGIRVLPIEINVDAVEVLVELDYLDPGDLEDLDKVSEATARFVSDMAEAVTCHSITLDTW